MLAKKYMLTQDNSAVSAFCWLSEFFKETRRILGFRVRLAEKWGQQTICTIERLVWVKLKYWSRDFCGCIAKSILQSKNRP